MALCGMVGTVAKARSILGDAEDGSPALGPYPRWVRVELVREARAGAYRTWTLWEQEDAALILEPLLRGQPTETFLACLLDTKHRPNAIHRCALGGIDSVPVEAQSVFAAALLANAAAVIVAHNHPSGDPEPSPQDVLPTHRLVRCGGILGIPVLDHLVSAPAAGRACAPSFRRAGGGSARVGLGGCRLHGRCGRLVYGVRAGPIRAAHPIHERKDREGNTVHPVFAADEWADRPECGACGASLPVRVADVRRWDR